MSCLKVNSWTFVLFIVVIIHGVYRIHIYEGDTDVFVISSTYYATSSIYKPNTIVILFNAKKSISQKIRLVCRSENTTHQEETVMTTRFAYNPTRECKLSTFIATCTSVAEPLNLTLSKSGNEEAAPLPLRYAYDKPSAVTVCFSPLFYFEQWQLLLTSLEIYRNFGADLQVLYIQSILQNVFDIITIYQKRREVAIESWATHEISAEEIERIGMNPNFELDWRNQAAAHTDCVLKYRESAEFIIIGDIDDVLIPKLKPNYFHEFQNAFSLSNNVASISYHRLNVKLIRASNLNSFSIESTLMKAILTQEQENPKYVIRTNCTETAWIHWPGITLMNTKMLQMPIKNSMLHLRNWRKPLDNFNFNASTSVLSHLTNRDYLQIQKRIDHLSLTKEYKKLPAKSIYTELLTECYEEMFYERNRQPHICPGPARCKIAAVKSSPCVIAKKPLRRYNLASNYKIFAAKKSMFMTIKNGCFL